MMPPAKAEAVFEPRDKFAEEPDDRANLRRMFWLTAFVVFSVAASLTAYLWLRQPNRHLEPTPYDSLISQLRKNMSEEDVLALFHAANENSGRSEISAYDLPSADGNLRVVSYKLDTDSPLTVRLGGSTGRTVVEWCYRDHCHDNVE